MAHRGVEAPLVEGQRRNFRVPRLFRFLMDASPGGPPLGGGENAGDSADCVCEVSIM